MSDFLKGNFTVKKAVVEAPKPQQDEAKQLAETLKKQVLTSLGGSMVYMERTGLIWDGEVNEESSKRD
mgnify:CR=1 FL=1